MPDTSLREIARAALLEITSAASIGADAGEIDEGDGVVSLQFACALPGYPGWNWTVTIATAQEGGPSVLEAELLPVEGALLAPDWVPWSERLAEWKAAQEATADDSETDEDVEDDELDDDDEESEDVEDDDFDDERPVLHSGDLDGVDIDEVDDSQ